MIPFLQYSAVNSKLRFAKAIANFAISLNFCLKDVIFLITSIATVASYSFLEILISLTLCLALTRTNSEF